jgi:hypothetical protein
MEEDMIKLHHPLDTLMPPVANEIAASIVFVLTAMVD